VGEGGGGGTWHNLPAPGGPEGGQFTENEENIFVFIGRKIVDCTNKYF
jgi:hypothetical protein